MSGWQPCQIPGETVLAGYGVRLEPFDSSQHGQGLHAAVGADAETWRYIPAGPFAEAVELCNFYAENNALGWRPLVILADGCSEPIGSFSFMRLRPEHGSVELGCVVYGPQLRRTRAGTAAFLLAADHVFDLGYRRYEWKCNASNEASRQAAIRYGFTLEGCFRQDMVVKGISRDTAWYSMLDIEWPHRRAALEAWLDPGNFDDTGAQRESLSAIRQRLAD